MSPRRLLPVFASGALVSLLACACIPWSVATPGLANRVAREFQRSYGVAMRVRGRTEIALLPLPRLGFSDVRLESGARDGPVLAEGGTLSLQLNLMALLGGRIDINTLSLDGAQVHLPVAEDDQRWAEPLARIGGRLATEGASHPRRVSLSRVTVTGCDPRNGTPQVARSVDVLLSWPLWSDRANLAGGFTWNDAPARFALTGLRLRDLIAGAASPFAATAEWPAGDLSAEGTGQLGGGLTLTGRGALRTRSLPETLAWAGGDVALSPFIERFGLDGSFAFADGTVMLPTVRVTAGSNLLEGAGSVSFGEGRPSVQATLAAESLNLAPLVGSLMRLFGSDRPDGGDAPEPGGSVALRPLTGGDLDLRISSGGGSLGPLLFDDLAASVLVRQGNIEASLNRARLGNGTVKGRLILAANAADAERTELRAQGSFDGLDLGEVLAGLGQDRWMMGEAQGQVLVEAGGRDAASLLGHVTGHAGFTVEGGALLGLDLSDMAHRNAAHRNGAVAPGALARRNGRTGFERAGITLRFTDGIGEIVDGSLKAASLTATLNGLVSLPERRVAARAELSLREAGVQPPMVFDVAGPWDAVTARPAGPEAGSRGEAVLAPKVLRLPATVRAYAPE